MFRETICCLCLEAFSLPTRYCDKVQGFNLSIMYSSPKWQNEVARKKLHVFKLSPTKFWDTLRKRMRRPRAPVALLTKLSGRSILTKSSGRSILGTHKLLHTCDISQFRRKLPIWSLSSRSHSRETKPPDERFFQCHFSWTVFLSEHFIVYGSIYWANKLFTAQKYLTFIDLIDDH